MRIEQRLSALEAVTRPARVWPFTDMERAVRLAYILNGPDCELRRKVVALLERPRTMRNAR